MPVLRNVCVFMLGAVLSAGGCPAIIEDGVSDEVVSGAYWVEQHAGTLEAYAMPKYRGDAGQWLALSAADAPWFTGAALYQVDDGGTWQRLTRDESLSLDALMQVWDPPPRVETPSGPTSIL